MSKFQAKTRKNRVGIPVPLCCLRFGWISLYIEQTLQQSTADRQRESSTLIRFVLLTTVAWHRTRYSIVRSLHNLTITAGRPHRTMQTYQYERAPNIKKWSHKLPDIRTVSINVFETCFFCPTNHVPSVLSEIFLSEEKKKIDHIFAAP